MNTLIRKIACVFSGRESVWHRRCARARWGVAPFIFLLSGMALLWFAADGRGAGGGGAGAVLSGQQPVVLAGMTPAELNRKGKLLRDMVRRDSSALKNMMDVDLRIAFGDPGLKREEGGVEVWQYRSGECVMDVYFQEPAPTHTGGREIAPLDYAHVVHYELRRRGKALFMPSQEAADDVSVDTQVCIPGLLEAHPALSFPAAVAG